MPWWLDTAAGSVAGTAQVLVAVGRIFKLPTTDNSETMSTIASNRQGRLKDFSEGRSGDRFRPEA